jgi:hypothetical protein
MEQTIISRISQKKNLPAVAAAENQIVEDKRGKKGREYRVVNAQEPKAS